MHLAKSAVYPMVPLEILKLLILNITGHIFVWLICTCTSHYLCYWYSPTERRFLFAVKILSTLQGYIEWHIFSQLGATDTVGLGFIPYYTVIWLLWASFRWQVISPCSWMNKLATQYSTGMNLWNKPLGLETWVEISKLDTRVSNFYLGRGLYLLWNI